MLERMIDENQLDYNRDEVTFISDLITGKRPSDLSHSFLYEIVANGRCAHLMTPFSIAPTELAVLTTTVEIA